MNAGDWKEEPLLWRGASTRLVELSTGEKIRFTRGALEGMARQVQAGIPMHVEHLTILPPVGLWFDAIVVEAADGEHELWMKGEYVSHYSPKGEDFEPFALMPDDRPGVEVPEAQLRTVTEPRNFSDEDFEVVRKTAPLEIGEENRWALLSPLEWVLPIVVTWGAVKFLGAFFEEAGRVSAKELITWIRKSSKRSREPNRDSLVTLRFELPATRYVFGHIVISHDDDEAAEAIAALAAAGELAEWAGAQSELDLIPGLRRAGYVWADGRWHLAWFITDGRAVYTTRWLKENMPDASRLLGRPLLEEAMADHAETDDVPPPPGD
jgi:hypothetical protein